MGLLNIFKKNDNKLRRVKNEPKVIFKNMELQIVIGQWLGVLPTVNFNEHLFQNIDSGTILKNNGLTKSQKEKIDFLFGQILKQIGVSENEVCIVTDLKQNNFCFKVYLKNGRCLNMQIVVDENKEFLSELKVDWGKKIETYFLSVTKLASLNLQCYELISSINGNKCLRNFSLDLASFNLENNGNNLSIVVTRPENEELQKRLAVIFRLGDEKELERYLLEASFPLVIDDVIKKLRECLSSNDLSVYPRISIRIFKKDKEKVFVTDLIEIKYGKVIKVKKTQGSKTVSWDINGSWSYHEDFAFGLEKNGCQIKPQEIFDFNSSEVEMIRRLIRDLMK